jgi:hypothetical protein
MTPPRDASTSSALEGACLAPGQLLEKPGGSYFTQVAGQTFKGIENPDGLIE